MRFGIQNESGSANLRMDDSFVRVGAFIAILFILLGIVIDYILYPHMLRQFFYLRFAACLLIAAIVCILGTKHGQKCARSLNVLWLLVPQVMISWMIFATDGPESPYHAALHLVVYGASYLLVLDFWHVVLVALFTLAIYICTCALYCMPVVLEDCGSLLFNALLLTFSVAINVAFASFGKVTRNAMAENGDQANPTSSNSATENIDLTGTREQRMQQESIAAIGALAAGLLHEINNPINYCLMALDVAAASAAAQGDSNLIENIRDAKHGMNRVQHIVSELKVFAYRRPDLVMNVHVFQLDRALNTAIHLAAHDLKDIPVTPRLSGCMLVLADEAAITSVLINLLKSAAIAVLDAGPTEPAIEVTTSSSGNRLLVSIRDISLGAQRNDVSNALEPDSARGAGLVLDVAISRATIQQHGGMLVAESNMGQWRGFTFDLPSADH